MMTLPPQLNPRRGKLLVAVTALTLLQSAAVAAAAIATRALFDAMYKDTALPPSFLVLLSAAGLAVGLTRIGSGIIGERLGQDYARDLRVALFEHAAGMPMHDVRQRRRGYMSLRFVGDMTAFRAWLARGLPSLIAGTMVISTALCVLWLLEPHFLFAILPLLVPAMLASSIYGLRLVALHGELRKRRAKIAADMAERMPLAPELDRLGRLKLERSQLLRSTDRMISVSLQRLTLAESLKAMPDALTGLSAAVLIYVGVLVDASAGTIAAALATVGLVLAPMRELGTIWNLRGAFVAARIKANAALNRRQRNQNSTCKKLPSGPITVTIDTLLLPSGAVLQLDVKPGMCEALHLSYEDAEFLFDILRGLSMSDGIDIRLSGVELCELSSRTLRRNIVHISTSPVILKGSLRRNLRLGTTKKISDNDLIQLAHEECLAPLFERMGGLDGSVTEDGRNLNSEEMTAISIVRARLLHPKLILLDSDIHDIALDRRIKALASDSGATMLLHCPVT